MLMIDTADPKPDGLAASPGATSLTATASTITTWHWTKNTPLGR